MKWFQSWLGGRPAARVMLRFPGNFSMTRRSRLRVEELEGRVMLSSIPILTTSSNWSGYVAAVRKTGVTCVEGSWVEPTVTCSKTGHQAVAIWIGIDGFSAKPLGIASTNVLVQLGTQVDCTNGVVRHGAWHEILPGETHEVPEPGPIRAGDP